jgi:hypothetical protein
VDDEALTLADDDKLEAIRRQLDVEFSRSGLRRGVLDEQVERERTRSNRAKRVRRVVGGVVLGCAAATLATALYFKSTNAPAPPAPRGVPEPTAAATPPNQTAQPTPSEPPLLAPSTPTAPSSSSSSATAPPTTIAPPPARHAVTTKPPESSRPITLPPRPARGAWRPPALSTPQNPPSKTVEVPVPPSSSPSNIPATDHASQRSPAASSPAPPMTGPEQASPGSRPVAPPAPASDPRVASARPGMMRYSDPHGLFGIEYPVGWRVRGTTAATKSTSFYLDDPDEGIAVIVLPPAAVHGNFAAAALAPIVSQQIRRIYPDFTLSALSTRPVGGGGEQGEFSARWTNRWAQRMRAEGMIVTARRGADTTYLYIAAQAQEFVFPGIEPILQRILQSFRLSSQG